MVARVRTTFGGMAIGPSVSTMFFQGSEDNTGAAQAVAAVAAFWTGIQSHFPSYGTWNVDGVVQFLDVASGQVTGVASVTGASGAGTSASEALPAFTQGLVRWKTGVFADGREIQGRTFIPGICENDNTTGGVPLSGWITAVQNAANTLNAVSTTVLVVYRRPREFRAATATLPELSQRDGVTQPVATAVVPNKFVVLRSRAT